MQPHLMVLLNDRAGRLTPSQPVPGTRRGVELLTERLVWAPRPGVEPLHEVPPLPARDSVTSFRRGVP